MPTEEEAPMALVYRKDNGERVQAPAHWMDHKTLSKPSRKPPLPGKAEDPQKPPAPAGTATRKD